MRRSNLSTILLAAALSVGVLLPSTGCSLREVSPPSPNPAPTPLPPDDTQPSARDHTDAEFWQALARRVAAGRVESTDEIILICKAAKEAGDLVEAAKLETALPTAATQNERITETNRARITDAIKQLR